MNNLNLQMFYIFIHNFQTATNLPAIIWYKKGEAGGKAEPKGWRNEAQLKAWKSVAQAELQLTKAELEGRGSLVEP